MDEIGRTRDVEVSLDADRTRIRLVGDVDVSLSRTFADAVSAAERADLPAAVDAGEVTFMDSSGIALLARLATRTPGRLQVIDPPEVVRFLLDVTRVGDMVELVETAHEQDPKGAA